MQIILKEYYHSTQLLIKRKYPDFNFHHDNHWLDKNSCCLLCGKEMLGEYYSKITNEHMKQHLGENNLLGFI